MQTLTTGIEGALLFAPTVHRDDRGYFTRTFDAKTGSTAGIDAAAFVQDSQSRSRLGAVRGMHLRAGRGESKLVRCARGAVLDVLFDARPFSASFGRVETFRLDDEHHHTLFVPRGVAHGWQALTDLADVCYRIDEEHDPAEDVTIRYDDPDLAIPWPLPVSAISERDAIAPSWAEVRRRFGW